MTDKGLTMEIDTIGKVVLFLVIVGFGHNIIFDKQYLRFNAIIWATAGIASIVLAMFYAREQNLWGIIALYLSVHTFWIANGKYKESRAQANSSSG